MGGGLRTPVGNNGSAHASRTRSVCWCESSNCSRGNSRQQATQARPYQGMIPTPRGRPETRAESMTEWFGASPNPWVIA